MPATRLMVTRMQQVNTNLNEIVEDGGEGIILRKPKSFYEKGRSALLLKLKASRGDREALVTDLDENNSLVLQLPEGETFRVKSESVVCSTNPKIGDVVTFSYEHYSRYALPVDPKVYRIRPDLDWKDVLHSFREDSQAQDLNELTNKLLRSKTQQKAPGHWKANKFENMKQLFIQFSNEQKFDPLVASNWYPVSQSDITAMKGGFSALQAFNGSYIKALLFAFPDIGLQESLFETLARHYWSSMKNRQKFFIDFAEKHSFDPLVAQNWYSKKILISQEPKASSVLTYYNNKSPISALIHLFPDIGLDPNKFDDIPNLFRIPANARRFLDNFAAQSGFEPLKSENWYSVSSDDIRRARGGSLLMVYNNSLHTALIELYPELHFHAVKFDTVSRNYWESRENKRKFFDEFAETNKFNPLIPENWYKVSTRMVTKTKSGSSVLHRHGGSLFRTLEDVYPEIKLHAARFGGLPRYYWFDVGNHRIFFEKFAKDNKFDPLIGSNWYNVDANSLIATKGASLLTYYQTFENAIIKNFPELKLDPNKFKQSMRRFAKRKK